MKKKIIVVNEKDEQICLKKRGTIQLEDIYRVSALIIFNSEGKFLMAQRSFSKKNSPGVWNTSVAGTNDEGETYLSNILKEAQEELGLDIQASKITEVFKIRSKQKHNYFCTRYTTNLNIVEKDCVLEKSEVEEVEFLNIRELKDKMKRFPEMYSQSFYEVVTKIVNEN